MEGKVCQIHSKNKWAIEKVYKQNVKTIQQTTNECLIAYYKVSNISIPTRFVFEFLEEYNSDQIPKWLTNMLATAVLANCRQIIQHCKNVGFQAVIFQWDESVSDKEAQLQYVPFIEEYHNFPALWITATNEHYIQTAIEKQLTIQFMLKAKIEENCTTETIWTISEADPTSSTAHESILVATHSDGVNSVEENGHLPLIQLAKWAAENKHKHQRNIIFVFATGHMRIPAIVGLLNNGHGDQALAAWLNQHEKEWNGDGTSSQSKKVVVGLVMEHLGAIKTPIFNNSNNNPSDGPPHPLEDELIYVTTDELYTNIFKPLWHKRKDVTTLAVQPMVIRFLYWILKRKLPGVHFGEGQPLFSRNIPAIAMVTGPSYTLQEFDNQQQPILEDLDLIKEQIECFQRILEKMDTASLDEFGKL